MFTNDDNAIVVVDTKVFDLTIGPLNSLEDSEERVRMPVCLFYLILVSLSVENHQRALVFVVQQNQILVRNRQHSPIVTLRERNLLVRFIIASIQLGQKGRCD